MWLSPLASGVCVCCGLCLCVCAGRVVSVVCVVIEPLQLKGILRNQRRQLCRKNRRWRDAETCSSLLFHLSLSCFVKTGDCVKHYLNKQTRPNKQTESLQSLG